MVSRTSQIETNPLRALFDRINRLEAELRELRAGRRAEATSIGAGGLTVKNGGGITVYDTNGAVVGVIGDLSSVGDEGRTGVWFARTSGTPALVASSTGNANDAGWVAIYDQVGNVIFADDVAKGRGLGRPYVPLPVGEVAPPAATTTSATFVDVATGPYPLQHKALYAYLLVRASDATTAGEARLTVNGTQYGSTLPISAGSYAYATIGPVAVDLGNAWHGSFQTATVQARRTAGAGTIGVRVMSLWGLDSAYA